MKSMERFCVNPLCIFFDMEVPENVSPQGFHVPHSPSFSAYFPSTSNKPSFGNIVHGFGLRREEAVAAGGNGSSSTKKDKSWHAENRHPIAYNAHDVIIRGHLCSTCHEVFKLFNV